MKLYHRYVCTCGARYSPWFQASTGSLGTYAPWIRGTVLTTVIVLSFPAQFVTSAYFLLSTCIDKYTFNVKVVVIVNIILMFRTLTDMYYLKCKSSSSPP